MAEKKKKPTTIEEIPGVGETTAAKLKEAGYDTFEVLAVSMPSELSEVAGIGEGTAVKIINAARDAMEMGYESADIVLERRKNIEKITTGSKELNNLLGGGIETMAITEAYGRFGSSKSQIAFQLCVNTQLPRDQGGLEGGVLFVDSEGSLPYEEKVLIKRNNQYHFEQIGKLVEEHLSKGKTTINGSESSAINDEKIECVSFDPADYKTKTFPITGFIKHPVKKVYKITLASGRSAKTTEYHNFFTLNEGGELAPTYMKDLKVGMVVPVPAKIPEINTQQMQQEEAEFFGAYVAEGSVIPDDRYGTGHYLTIVTAKNPESTVAGIVNAFTGKAGLKAHRNKMDYRIYSKKLTEKVKNCYTGQKYDSHNKLIPQEIFNAPTETKQAFLRGYLAGDGSFDKLTNTQNADTVSPHLADGLLYLAAFLGIPARMQLRHREGLKSRGGPSDCYNVHWASVKKKDALLELLPNDSNQIGKLLVKARKENNLKQKEVGVNGSIISISQIETGSRKKVSRTKLRQILEKMPEKTKAVKALEKLINSEMWFDEIASIEYCGEEVTYDLEVQPNGQKIENFVAGTGGIFLHNTFRPERVAQMARAKGLDEPTILKNIQIARAHNSDHQMLLIEKAGELIKEKGIRLVIVDSLMSGFRSEYLGRGQLAERQQKINKHVHELQKLADVYNVAIYITNQVMDRPDIMFGDPIAPIGGNVIAHSSTYRLYVRRSKENRRIAKLVDSPNLPDGECVFTITENGVEDAE